MKKKAKYGAKGAQMTVKITKAIKKSAGKQTYRWQIF